MSGNMTRDVVARLLLQESMKWAGRAPNPCRVAWHEDVGATRQSCAQYVEQYLTPQGARLQASGRAPHEMPDRLGSTRFYRGGAEIWLCEEWEPAGDMLCRSAVISWPDHMVARGRGRWSADELAEVVSTPGLAAARRRAA